MKIGRKQIICIFIIENIKHVMKIHIEKKIFSLHKNVNKLFQSNWRRLRLLIHM